MDEKQTLEEDKDTERMNEEEVSHSPPVTIYHNLFNDINIHIYFKPFVQPLSRPWHL